VLALDCLVSSCKISRIARPSLALMKRAPSSASVAAKAATNFRMVLSADYVGSSRLELSTVMAATCGHHSVSQSKGCKNEGRAISS
jgi:hypothetical protein